MELIIWTLLNLEKDLWIQNQKMGSLNDLTKAQVRPYHERLVCFRRGNICFDVSCFPIWRPDLQPVPFRKLAKLFFGFDLFINV